MTESPQDRIGPVDLAEYLASRGWEKHGIWRGATIWATHGADQILVPDRRQYPDDDELLDEAVRKLAKFEERPEEEVLLDITEPEVDTQLFRTHPDSPSGTTPLVSGLRAVQAVHDLMKIAARTVEDGPRLLFEGRRSAPVNGFLQRVMLGTTRPGSYILTARVPITNRYSQMPLFDNQLSGRAVVLQLDRAVRAAGNAALRMIREDDGGALDEAVERGVSANLCSALSDLGGPSRDRPFEISFSWARSQPVGAPRQPVAFTDPMTKTLARAARELEDLAKSGEASVTGQVKTLDEGVRVKVTGVLRTQTGQVRRSVWVVVGPIDYQRAFSAQSKGWTIQASGRLTVAQNRLELRPGPSGLEIRRR